MPEHRYRCPACRGRLLPKGDWPINPHLGHIQCACGRIPDRYERIVCIECGGKGYWTDTPASPESCSECGATGHCWVHSSPGASGQ